MSADLDNPGADPAAVDAFLAEPRNGIVAGLRLDGTPHLTPNWFLWDGARFLISTTEDRIKTRIFRRDPRVSFIVDDTHGFRYVLVEGTVAVEDDVETGLAHFRDLRHKHGRHEQDDDQLRAEMIRDRRVTLVITPTLDRSAWHTKGF